MSRNEVTKLAIQGEGNGFSACRWMQLVPDKKIPDRKGFLSGLLTHL